MEPTLTSYLNKVVNQYEVKINELQNTVSSLRTELAHAEKKIKDQEEELKVYYTEREHADANLLQEKPADKNKITENVNSLIKLLQAELATKTRQEKQIQEQLQSVMCQLAEQKRQNEKLTGDLSMSKIANENVINQLECLQATNEHLRAGNRQLSELIKQTGASFQLNLEEMEKSRLNTEKLNTERDQLQQQLLTKMQATLDDFSKTNNGLVEEIRGFRKDARVAKEQLEEASKSFERHFNELSFALERGKLPSDRTIPSRTEEPDTLTMTSAQQNGNEPSVDGLQQKLNNSQLECEDLRVSKKKAENRVVLQEKVLADKNEGIQLLQREVTELNNDKHIKQKGHQVPTAPKTPKGSYCNVSWGVTPKAPRSNLRMAATPKTPHSNVRITQTPKTKESSCGINVKALKAPQSNGSTARTPNVPRRILKTYGKSSRERRIVFDCMVHSGNKDSITEEAPRSLEDQSELSSLMELFPNTTSPEPSIEKNNSKRQSTGQTKKIDKTKVKKLMPKIEKLNSGKSFARFDSESVFDFGPDD